MMLNYFSFPLKFVVYVVFKCSMFPGFALNEVSLDRVFLFVYHSQVQTDFALSSSTSVFLPVILTFTCVSTRK